MPTIIPKTPADRHRLAVELLAAAGDHPERVQTITPGGQLAFVVDDDLAAKVGTSDYAPNIEPEVAPRKRGRPRKNPL